MSEQLPLSIRDTKPHPDAVRLTGTHANGIPDGVHTGGAWLHDGWVYKPLDGRPYANAEFHMATLEAECLDECKDIPLFPSNWRVEEIRGRKFLIRRKAYILNRDKEWEKVDRELALQVEWSIREANRRRWEISDYITIGFDKTLYRKNKPPYFIVDLSTAHKVEGNWHADDYHYIKNFFNSHGFERLSLLRQNAAEASTTARMKALIDSDDRYTKDHRHVYASFNRPIDALWASIDKAVYVHTDNPNWSTMTPHTWVITPYELSQETLDRYELTWGWSPVYL